MPQKKISVLLVTGESLVGENSLSTSTNENSAIFTALKEGNIEIQIHKLGKSVGEFEPFNTIIYNGTNPKLLQLMIRYCSTKNVNLLNISKEKDIIKNLAFPEVMNFVFLDAPCINIDHLYEIKKNSNKENWFDDIDEITSHLNNLDYSDIVKILFEINILNTGKYKISDLIDFYLL